MKVAQPEQPRRPARRERTRIDPLVSSGSLQDVMDRLEQFLVAGAFPPLDSSHFRTVAGQDQEDG